MEGKEVMDGDDIEIKIDVGEVFLGGGSSEVVQRSKPDLICPVEILLPADLSLAINSTTPESSKLKLELARLQSGEIKSNEEDPLATFECDECELKFMTNDILVNHKSESHSCQVQQNEIKVEDEGSNSDHSTITITSDDDDEELKNTHQPKRLKSDCVNDSDSDEQVVTWPCRVKGCDEKFFFVSQRTKHEVGVHRYSGTTYTCPKCPEWKGLSKLESYQHFERLHPEGRANEIVTWSYPKRRKHKCTHCQDSFTSVTDFKNHLKQEHSDKPGLRCRVEGCSLEFLCTNDRTHHEIKVHRFGGKPYKCPSCPEWKGLMLRELKEHCSRVHPSAEDKDKPKPRRFPCYSCEESYDNVQDLRNHVSEKHSGELGLTCRVEGCCEKFLHTSARSYHEVKVHRFTSGGKLYTCPQCPEWEGWTSREFKEHSVRVHLVEDKRVKCDTCEETFANSRVLKIHQTIHTGIKLIQCTEQDCGLRFNTKESLESHITSEHKKEKPFPCESCDRRFINKRLLNNHVRNVHCPPEDKKFACQHCDLKFGTKSQLEAHTRKHTGGKKFICEKCGKGYNDKKAMTTHIVFKHRYDEDVQEKYWRQE